MNEDICSRDAEQFAPDTRCSKSVSGIAGIWASTCLTPNLSKLSTLVSRGSWKTHYSVFEQARGWGLGLLPLDKQLENDANFKSSSLIDQAW